MPAKGKKKIKVQDLKPKKDAKGGARLNISENHAVLNKVQNKPANLHPTTN